MEEKDANQDTFNSTEEAAPYDDDANNKNDWEQIKKRNAKYTEFLDRYYSYINKVLQFKEDKRIRIYQYSLIILAIPMLAIAVTLYILSKNDFNSINNLIAYITALGALISSMIVIPTKIGEYLFNNDDTLQMVEIIKNIQDYDKNVRTDIRERRKKL